MRDAVALKVLGSGEGLPTALLRADKATVVVVFPELETGKGDVNQ